MSSEKDSKSIWPLYFADQVIIGNLQSNVAIITLWTEKERIAGKIDRKLFSIAGQLYSKVGINMVIRNVFANPLIRYIVLCGADTSHSGLALLKLKENGIDDRHNVIGIENSHIEKEIPKDAVEEFRKNVEIIDLRDVSDPRRVEEAIKKLLKKEPFAKPKTFPEPKFEMPDRFPTDHSVFKVKAKTVGIAWLNMLFNIMRFGHVKKSHHSNAQRELLNIIAVITDEDTDDAVWYDFFNFTKEELENYYPQVLTPKKFEGINYTYGQRLMDHDGIDQIKSIIEKLKKEPFTRRAVAVTWDVDKDVYNEHAPCLDLVNFIVQDDRLFMNVYFRSHDIYRGWPQNCFALRKLQQRVSRETGIKMGSMTVFSASAHIYEESWKEVQEILDVYYNGPEHEWDPRGNMVIKVEDGRIKLAHYSQSSKKLQEFEAKTAIEMFKLLEKHHAISMIPHALDVGAELQKAEIALKLGKKYNQDNPLDFR